MKDLDEEKEKHLIKAYGAQKEFYGAIKASSQYLKPVLDKKEKRKEYKQKYPFLYNFFDLDIRDFHLEKGEYLTENLKQTKNSIENIFSNFDKYVSVATRESPDFYNSIKEDLDEIRDFYQDYISYLNKKIEKI
jgi:hypothetical protein